MADLTPERIAELRRTKALDTPPYLIYDEDLDGLLDMAERCAKAEAKAAAYDKLCESQREQWSSITRDIVLGQNKQEEA